ncbi:MAG TPA: lipid A deacylase LpxR family protein [Gammaproteobacteria bacterium]
MPSAGKRIAGKLVDGAGRIALRPGAVVALTLALVAAAFPAAAAGAGRDHERDVGWTLHVDNDLFAFTDDDRDYTAGVAFTLGGDAARENVLAKGLDWLDSRTPLGRFFEDRDAEHSVELGLVLFTPNDLSASEPLADDRPYASLTYAASTRLAVDGPVAHQSSLTIGFLGLPFAEQLHRGVHEVVGSQEPMGYHHQISDGGEPTFRYAMSRYRLLDRGSWKGKPYSVRLDTTASVGYLTEAGAELSVRWGSFDAPWWSSLPSASDYAGHPPIRAPRPGAQPAKPRVQLSAGVSVRARLYNAFLQGQFRSSDVTHSFSDLDHLLFEAWVGVTTVLKNDLSLSYTVRHQTEEIRAGRGARGFTWASIGVAQQF